MIDVNFTIIIQMINFFICFLMLKYLLFKPTAKYLQTEEKKEEAISEKISFQENNLKNKVSEKNKTWAKYEQYFKKNCPKQTKEKLPAIKDFQKESSTIEISNQEIEILAKHAEKALLDRIDHARK
ncbi:MAG: ATP synthase subunit b [candidate division TM6 bacterium GW2011_GWF2_30_66]|jgi:F0F1-type ATP synthase membrane subunit b/b'|nr:MAG: ATP synthase subunit b [candidate division TM6 bacterium GW2011_GWF2_30_66]